MVGDTIFWASLRNAALFGLIGFVAGNALSLAMAVAVNAAPRGATFFRIAYYLPGVFSVVVVGMMFAWMLQPSVGILNRALGAVGLAALKHRWLSDPGTALPSVAAWSTSGIHWGFGFLLFLAGLQSVPRELYEAASIDGAGAWQRFRHVTWPQLTPVTTIVSVLTLLGALQIFGTVQVLTERRPRLPHRGADAADLQGRRSSLHRFGRGGRDVGGVRLDPGGAVARPDLARAALVRRGG